MPTPEQAHDLKDHEHENRRPRVTTTAAVLLGFLTLVSAAPVAAPQDAAEAVATAVAPRRGLTAHEPGALDGYTLVAPLASKWIFLVDMAGEEVHRWETDLGNPGAVYLLDDGYVLRCARQEDNPRFRGGGIGGRLQKYDWDGNLVWDYQLADDYQTQHHDIEPLPNGNVLAIVWEHRYREDAIEAGRDPKVATERGMWTLAVLELKPLPPDDAEVVWEWHVWDHLVQDLDPEKMNHGSVPDDPGRLDINADHRDRPPMNEAERERLAEQERQMRALGYTDAGDDGEESDSGPRSPGRSPDWLHTNGIDYLPGHDLIVLSTPQLNELWVIDHSTTTDEAAWGTGGKWGKGGRILYRWGNPRNYGAGHDEDRRLFYQHDPTWIVGEDANDLRLLVFNNGGGRPGDDFSSVEELVLPFDPEKGFVRAADQPFGPARPAWYYLDKENFFSSFISGAQRLPNGNTLICSGAQGRVFEVTPDKQVVWDWVNHLDGGRAAPSSVAPATAVESLFRATRIARDDPRLAGRGL